MNTLVFDIETVPDVEFGRRLFGLDGLSDDEVGKAMQAKSRQDSGSDFLPHEQHRIVAEVVFTIGQGGATTLEFLVRTPAGERRTFAMPLPKSALPCGETFENMERELAALQTSVGDAAPPPTTAMVPLAARNPICIALDVGSDGLGVRSRRDRLDASCSDLAKDAGPALATLPAESGKLPLGAASICANTIKKRFPQAVASRVTVRASGETPWRDVVAVIDTFGPPAGFGDPILAAPK